MFKKVIYILIALLGFALYAKAQTANPVTIAGKVIDENGTAIKAKIKLIDVAENKVVEQVNATDPSQKHHFGFKGNYLKGKYLMYVWAEGYLFYSTYLELDDVEKTPRIFNIRLKKTK
ncbi:MAG TPA: hypothetical protein DCS93_07335 [Microscillaceae bacterium]|nr:hypothetical protein [Microscillaceae bacterium]